MKQGSFDDSKLIIIAVVSDKMEIVKIRATTVSASVGLCEDCKGNWTAATGFVGWTSAGPI